MKYQMECEALQAYLASSHYIDWQHPLIQRKAAELFTGCKEEREKIKAAFLCAGRNSPFRRYRQP